MGIPYLFHAKANDPDRFAYIGSIRGCASEGKDKYGTMPTESAECTCKDGTEDLGCSDALNTSDHELICSKILNSTVYEVDAGNAFKPGGICRIEGTDHILSPIMAAKNF